MYLLQGFLKHLQGTFAKAYAIRLAVLRYLAGTVLHPYSLCQQDYKAIPCCEK